MLPRIGEYCADIEVIAQNSRVVDTATNAAYAAHVVDRYLGCVPERWQYSLGQDCPVRERELRDAAAQAILSYERYPARTCDLPVVWITGPSLSENHTGKCARPEWIERELRWKIERAERAGRVLFTSTDNLHKFIEQCGERFRPKTSVVPFFLPGLSAIQHFDGKWDADELRLLFVGREANRKGLPQLLRAIEMLPADAKLSLAVVSTFADGAVQLPRGTTVHSESSHERVLEWMAQAHILAMPSMRENYGFVYVEAMSRGCIPLALDRPVQREIAGDGGILASSAAPEAIAEVLTPALEMGWVQAKARKALQQFENVHAPAVVAARLRDVIAAAITSPL